MPTIVATTNSGQEWTAKKVLGNDAKIMQYLALGSSNTPTATPNDTTLSSQVGARQAATITNPAARFAQYVASFLFPGGGTVAEAGVFTDSSGGVMDMRMTFDAIVVPNNTSVELTMLHEYIAV